MADTAINSLMSRIKSTTSSQAVQHLVPLIQSMNKASHHVPLSCLDFQCNTKVKRLLHLYPMTSPCCVLYYLTSSHRPALILIAGNQQRRYLDDRIVRWLWTAYELTRRTLVLGLLTRWHSAGHSVWQRRWRRACGSSLVGVPQSLHSHCL